MTLHKIKSRHDNSVLYELECHSIKECVGGAVKSNANLRDAYLGGANLVGADLRGADLGEKVGKLKERGLFSAGPLGSREDYLLAFHTDLGIFVRTGCFFDSLEAFRAAVIKTHGEESKHGKLYLGICNVIEFKFLDEGAKHRDI